MKESGESVPIGTKKPRDLRPAEKLLASALDLALVTGATVLTTSDIVAKFPPMAIMEGLADQPGRRADILKACAVSGARATVCRQSWQWAGEGLEGALEVGDTNPDQIVKAMPADDAVRYLPARLIQELLFQSGWREKDTKEHKRLAYQLVDLILELDLLEDVSAGKNTHCEVVEAIGLLNAEQVAKLPPALTAEVMRHSMRLGRAGQTWDDKVLLSHPLLEPKVLVEYLEVTVLMQVWDTVVVKYGWLGPESVKNEPAPGEVVVTDEMVAGEEKAGEGVPEAVAEFDEACTPTGLRMIAELPPKDSADEVAAVDKAINNVCAEADKVAPKDDPTGPVQPAEDKRKPPPLPKRRNRDVTGGWAGVKISSDPDEKAEQIRAEAEKVRKAAEEKARQVVEAEKSTPKP